MRLKGFFSMLLIVIIFSCMSSPSAWAKKDYSQLAAIPVLQEGRIKPLDTYARVYMLLFSGKQSHKDLKPLKWLVDLILNPDDSYDIPVFKIVNPDVVESLSLKKREKHLYSFNELVKSMQGMSNIIEEIHKKQKNERTPAQQELADLYIKISKYYDLSRSFSLLLPAFDLSNESLAAKIGHKAASGLTYLNLIPHRNEIAEVARQLRENNITEPTEENVSFGRLFLRMLEVERDSHNQALLLFPDAKETKTLHWLSPWENVLQGEFPSPNSEYFLQWGKLAAVYNQANDQQWNEVAQSVAEKSKTLVSPYKNKLLALEVFYSQWDLITKSMALYLGAFLLLAISWMGRRSLFEKLAFATLGLGVLCHLTGLVMRILIMQRPPVSTLYESIIFVALITTLLGFIFEKIKKNGVGVLVGSVSGLVLLFISLGYAKEGDTMGMLVAVLNTNFWLATHVVMITIGYGCCLVSGVVGHVYLIKRVLNWGDKNEYRLLYRNMVGLSLFALFFALFGTILGGIWADQSWGRFWGWDPKENGAMLIVLWLLWLLHGRLSGEIKELGYAFGMVATNIIVALAWFGVNLLNIGLHSYGFTENIAYNLLAFCTLELCFGLSLYSILKRRELTNG